ncbi:MAG: hypothetical protein R3323_04270 [Wenzhouxiangellaceae bacterium]|nr:hypothetical protein [Wenzhouxiangellaceae bacterium]
MRIEDRDAEATAGIVSDAFGAEVRVEGLSADTVRALFSPEARPADPLPEGRPIRLALEGNGTGPGGPEPVVERLDDGTALCRPGGPAEVRPADPRSFRDRLIPRCLHLGLAQQWARAGLATAHAAAFEIDGRGVLAFGPSTAGKSLLTLAASARGARVVSDDWLLLGIGPDGPRAERLREFLMVRAGGEALLDALLAAQPGLAVRRAGDRKVVPLASAPSERFPHAVDIDETWVMQVPEGPRRDRSEVRPVAAAAVLARLVESSMPLLFGASFPAERAALMQTARTWIQRSRCVEVETGTDLIEDPDRAWARLLT